ncbi:hypothetical protein EDB81DRAFT_950881 [Dactylonectria macrodidyma]|uniref:Nephrocystin 3-like N-terminal domain-containing protein n=1 Tax=Dactylonectria macrodidyma TaxID=307937 RepID=A0A9P9E0K0_9HYPO|nr:hypothetical protein EDB81DRAFT_950881 [Dactylonectria macrodidyma]
MSILLKEETGNDVLNSEELDSDAVLIERTDVSDFNPGHILPKQAVVLDAIKSWLKPTEYDHDGSDYQKYLYFRLAGTGNWVYDTAVYRQWHQGADPGILWVRGAQGSRKSVLAASVIKKLSQEECPVLYFFFRHTIAANHSATPAVRDWLAQVLKFSPPLQVELRKCSEVADGKELSVENLSLAELFHLLHTALSHLPKAYIVIDALDEMDQAGLEPFRHHFYELGKWRPFEVKLLMTSRPVAVVEKIVRAVKVLNVRLDKQRVESDISTYVQHRLAGSLVPADSRSRVAAFITDRCASLFLYARLAEQPIRTDIPVGLQQLVLEFATHAIRPLRLLGISDLINVTHHMGDLAKTKDLMRSICGPLLEVRPGETVHVVHHSLAEFLNGTTRDTDQSAYPVFEPGTTHNRLALLCISYLRDGSLDSVVPEPSRFDRHKRQIQSYHILPPFTRKGADVEARDGEDITPLAAAMEAINGPHFDRMAAKILLHILLEAKPYLCERKDPGVARIIVAAPGLVYAGDSQGRTPLHTAFHYGIDTRHIYDLIDAGANFQASVKSTGETLLHLLFRQIWHIGLNGEVKVGEDLRDPEPVCSAAVIEFEKQESFLQRLLTMGFEVNARNDKGETPIFTFFRGAEVIARTTHHRNNSQAYLAEKWAAVEREYLIWPFLDELGVNWTAVNFKKETLLHVVVAGGKWSRNMVRRFEFLVGNGLDPMHENEDLRTPLDVAAALELR